MKLPKLACLNGPPLAPLILLNTDSFESGHAQHKGTRQSKRTSVNPLFTMISQNERLSVYNSTGHMIPMAIQKKIKKVSRDNLVQTYLQSFKVPGGIMYQCSKMTIYGTTYKSGEYLILPESTNSSLVIGKICSLLCCQEYAYFKYQRNATSYCPKTDLYYVKGLPEYDIVASHHLADYRPLQAKFYNIPILQHFWTKISDYGHSESLNSNLGI